MIIINGTSLTVEQVAAVARTGEQVAISDEAKAAVNLMKRLLYMA